jgi:hypothetical protein
MKITVYFLHGNSEEKQLHYKFKERRTDIIAEVDGIFHEVYFFVEEVLRYEMRKDGFFSYPGLIIVEELTTENILNAIENLADMGYFDLFKGYSSLPEEGRFISKWYMEGTSFKGSNIDIVKLRE